MESGGSCLCKRWAKGLSFDKQPSRLEFFGESFFVNILQQAWTAQLSVNFNRRIRFVWAKPNAVTLA